MPYVKTHIPKRPMQHYKIYCLLIVSEVVGFENYGYNYMCYYSEASRAIGVQTSQLKIYLSLMQQCGLIENLKQYGKSRCKFTLTRPKDKQ